MIGRRNVSNTLFEWQIDSLAAAANNVQLEGEELSRSASTATTRATAMCQISFKDATVTGTQRSVSHAGANDQLALQMTKRSKELKRDIEKMATANNAAVTGDATTARETGGLGAWFTSNVSRGGGSGASGSSGTTAAGEGTQRALAEGLVETVAQSVYTNGGEAKIIMCGPFNKTKISDFTGRTNSRHMVDENAVSNNVTVYDSDFGNFKVVINRFQREREVWLIDPGFARLAFLRNFQVNEIAKIGDADTRMILAEWGLQIDNEAAHGVVADLDDS